MAIRTVAASLARQATRSFIRTRTIVARRNFSTEWALNLKKATGKRYPTQGTPEGISGPPKAGYLFWGTVFFGFFLVPWTYYMRKSAKAVEKFQKEQALKAQLPSTVVVAQH